MALVVLAVKRVIWQHTPASGVFAVPFSAIVHPTRSCPCIPALKTSHTGNGLASRSTSPHCRKTQPP